MMHPSTGTGTSRWAHCPHRARPQGPERGSGVWGLVVDLALCSFHSEVAPLVVKRSLESRCRHGPGGLPCLVQFLLSSFRLINGRTPIISFSSPASARITRVRQPLTACCCLRRAGRGLHRERILHFSQTNGRSRHTNMTISRKTGPRPLCAPHVRVARSRAAILLWHRQVAEKRLQGILDVMWARKGDALEEALAEREDDRAVLHPSALALAACGAAVSAPEPSMRSKCIQGLTSTTCVRRTASATEGGHRPARRRP